jgi:hypothetical protein
MDEWILRLKRGYDASYYKTEAAEGMQLPFPWQNATCSDCPFWLIGLCQVFEEQRSETAHTCSYFDPWNHEEARMIIGERYYQGFRRWWDWFNDRDKAR